MPVYYFDAVIPLGSLLLNVLVQIASIRLKPRIGLLNSVFFGFSCGLVGLFILEFHVNFLLRLPLNDFMASLVINTVTYFCLCYCYFCFLNLGETARRIRIIRELFDAKEGLYLAEIIQRYNSEEIIERRLMRLIKNRQVIFKEDKYYIGLPMMLYMATSLVILKLILLGKKSEFD